MIKPLDKRVEKILKELDFDPKECLWDCHGTWVMYHRFIEIAGAKNNIFYLLSEIETNSKEGIVCIKCEANIASASVANKITTYGEASPKNNKNAYPYAMAEKRAVDRAILKLLGLHGFIYSEDEIDMSQVKKEDMYEKQLPEGLKKDAEKVANQIVDLFVMEDHEKALDLVFNVSNDFKLAVAQSLKASGHTTVKNKLKKLSEKRHLDIKNGNHEINIDVPQ